MAAFFSGHTQKKKSAPLEQAHKNMQQQTTLAADSSAEVLQTAVKDNENHTFSSSMPELVFNNLDNDVASPLSVGVAPPQAPALDRCFEPPKSLAPELVVSELQYSMALLPTASKVHEAAALRAPIDTVKTAWANQDAAEQRLLPDMHSIIKIYALDHDTCDPSVIPQGSSSMHTEQNARHVQLQLSATNVEAALFSSSAQAHAGPSHSHMHQTHASGPLAAHGQVSPPSNDNMPRPAQALHLDMQQDKQSSSGQQSVSRIVELQSTGPAGETGGQAACSQCEACQDEGGDARQWQLFEVTDLDGINTIRYAFKGDQVEVILRRVFLFS